MNCPNDIAKLLIEIDGYAEKKDPSIFQRLNAHFIDPESIADVLRYWPEKYHYSALLYLRNRGYDAWASDTSDRTTEIYKYKPKDIEEYKVIVPLHKRDLAHLNKMLNVWLKDTAL